MGRNRLDMRYARDLGGNSEATPHAGMLLVSSTDQTIEPFYMGWEAVDGRWCIQKTNSGDDRYAKGDSGFLSAWANKASLGYDIPSVAWSDEL